jgi:phosphotriesterase-related protein
MVLSHDTACYIDWFPHDEDGAGNYTYIHDAVLPALAERGVTPAQIETMLVANPRRYFTPPADPPGAGDAGDTAAGRRISRA